MSHLMTHFWKKQEEAEWGRGCQGPRCAYSTLRGKESSSSYPTPQDRLLLLGHTGGSMLRFTLDTHSQGFMCAFDHTGGKPHNEAVTPVGTL